MNKTKRLAAFEGIDTDILNGSSKNKEIVKLFLEDMDYKEIANKFGLTVSRIGQILDKQARIANSYKNLQNDSEYQTLVKEYARKIENGEEIIISSEINDMDKHLSAFYEANIVSKAAGTKDKKIQE